MGRYDWPRGPRRQDDPSGRGAHLAQLRPSADVMTLPPTAAPAPRRRRSRAIPHNAPSGAEYLWTSIGPVTMMHGQATGAPNVAGRIRDLTVEPQVGQRVYAASGGGGVWFSNDAGSSWRPLDEWQISNRDAKGTISNALACGAIHVIWGDPHGDGSDDVIWVGTGEPSLQDSGAFQVGGETADWLRIGGQVGGVGFLKRDATGVWTVELGDPPAPGTDTLRGERFYRITADPGNTEQLIAATTKGLYLKAPNADWVRIPSYPATNALQPLDVVLTRTAPTKLRIWVAGGSKVTVAELTIAAATAINPLDPNLVFSTVQLPSVATSGTCLQITASGNTVYVLGRTNAAASTGNAFPAAVWTINAAADPLPTTASAPLSGTPADLFKSSSDQSNYDMCIAAHPTVAGRIYIGGAAFSSSDQWNGAIYRCEIAGTTLTPTYVGDKTHSDVHVLRIGAVSPTDASKHTVWTGTDGGMFRSDADADPGTFTARNTGLAVLQPGFVANHPTNPGIVVAGFQDNGTAVRKGDGVWEQKFEGDGGGVVFDPSSTNRYYRQYAQCTWQSSDGGGVQPVNRRNAREVQNPDPNHQLKTSEEIESGSSAFYSGAAAVQHGGDTHLVVGSDRVWYSRDWGRNWVTLPTATDPRSSDNPNVVQDVLQGSGPFVQYLDRTGSVETCSTNHAGRGQAGFGIVTTRICVAPDDASGARVLRVLALYSGGLTWITGTRSAASGPFTWNPTKVTQLIKDPVPGSADETALRNGQTMTFLPAADIVSDTCVHNATRGALGSCYVATTGVDIGSAPNAIQRDTLWFFDGTDRWLPTGLKTTFNGTWTDPAQRVTAPALAVAVDPDDPNIVYVGTSVGVVRGVLAITGTPAAPVYQWTWTQMMNGLPEAVVQDLSIFDSDGVKVMRAALQARGVWEVDLATVSPPPLSYLRTYRTDTRRKLPTVFNTPIVKGDDEDPPSYNNSPDIVLDVNAAAPTVPPSEGDLAAMPRLGSAGVQTHESLSQRQFRVHVLAHHRVADLSIPKNHLRVALMQKAIPSGGVTTLDGVWPALVSAAGTPAQPASLPGGWQKAAGVLWKNPADDVDPRLPRAVTFDVDLTGQPSDTAIMLVAVVMNTSNQITAAEIGAAQDVEVLVMASPHVAAKAILLE